MPFAQLKNFNHTDPFNKTTESDEIEKLNNEFWDRSKKDRIVVTCPTKRKGLKPTSSNTHYGRSELRQVDPNNGKLKTAIKIAQYPFNFVAVRDCILDTGPEGKTIGLQWHGSSTRPLVKGQWELDKKTDTYTLNIQLADVFEGKDPSIPVVTGVKRGEVFDLLFGFSEHEFIAAYNWLTDKPIIWERPINKDGSYAKDKGLYAKLGAYVQTDINCSYEKMREGQGRFVLFDFRVYSGEKVDLKTIDLDKDSYWRVGETFTLDAPERSALPPKEGTKPQEPTQPATQPTPTPQPPKPTAPIPPAAGDGSSPSPATPESTAAADLEALLKDVPMKSKASIQKLVTQIQGNIKAGAKKTAKDNLSTLEDQLDQLDDSEGKKLRLWCNEQRAAVK